MIGSKRLSVLLFFIAIAASSCDELKNQLTGQNDDPYDFPYVRPIFDFYSNGPVTGSSGQLPDTISTFLQVIEHDGSPLEPIVIFNRLDLGESDSIGLTYDLVSEKQRFDVGQRYMEAALKDYRKFSITEFDFRTLYEPSSAISKNDSGAYDFYLVDPEIKGLFEASKDKVFTDVRSLYDHALSMVHAKVADNEEDDVTLKILIVGKRNLPSSCNDGIKNGQETDIDCGGPDCISCCEDGIRNGKEVDIDCGGDCVPCCEDGKKNNGETGIDCGGPKCQPCPPRVVSMVVRPDGLYDKQKKVQRAVQNLDWMPVPEASKYVLRFTTKEGKLKDYIVSNGSVKSLSLLSLGVGTTDDVWEMTIRGYDSSDRLVGKGGLDNFTISCN